MTKPDDYDFGIMAKSIQNIEEDVKEIKSDTKELPNVSFKVRYLWRFNWFIVVLILGVVVKLVAAKIFP